MLKLQHKTGYISEQIAALHFAERDYIIYWPNHSQSSCDFIACKDEEIIRVQVKSAYWSKNKNNKQYLICTVRKGHGQSSNYSRKECDMIFIVFENRKWIIPIKELSNEHGITLDRKQPKERNWKSSNKDWSLYEVKD